MTNDTTTTAPAPHTGPLARAFAPLAGLTSLAILCQAVSAGEFLAQRGSEAWAELHDAVGYVTLLLAVATAVVGIIAFRKTSPLLMWASIALAALVAVQAVIGHLITDLEQDGWIGLHVPLALVVFGLTAWLAVRSGAERRGNSGAASRG